MVPLSEATRSIERAASATPLAAAGRLVVEIHARAGEISPAVLDFGRRGGTLEKLAELLRLGELLREPGHRVAAGAEAAQLLIDLVVVEPGARWSWVGDSNANCGQVVTVVAVGRGTVTHTDGDLRDESDRGWFLAHYRLLPEQGDVEGS